MTSEELQLRQAVVCASGLIYWAGVFVQGRRIRKKIGRSPNLKPKGIREKALFFGWFLVILVWIGQPPLIGALQKAPVLQFLPMLLNPLSLVLGISLVVLGYAGTLWCYAAMGDTWRIGINKREKTTLVESGPYRWVRHPIYALQVVMLAGAAFLLPTVLSLGALLGHVFCVRIKARDEEKHLESVHGTAYSAYMTRTGALMPRWIRGHAPVLF